MRSIAQQENDAVWNERKAKRRREELERIAKILKFLRAHPWSSAQEIFTGCGCYVGNGHKFITHSSVKRGDPRPVTLYAVNEEKYQKWLNHE